MMMKSFMKTIAVLTISFSGVAMASTWDDIAAIDAAKGKVSVNVNEHQPVTQSAKWYRLSDGRQVDLNNWTVVLFMQSTCSYCHKFDPLLHQITEQIGLPVFVYSLDGVGDVTYPDALAATPDVMVDYFQNGTPVATPTTFLTNVNTNTALPLIQGAVDGPAFLSRLDEVFQVALNGGLK